ncbi:hypothetical protein SDC9_142668 [bioreactor metagenome]|uniref:Uncharacterized protein n=1 Tax=bioreactor metagenome TaxID=1076179 RepID=A0A645E154_9ZZZZ
MTRPNRDIVAANLGKYKKVDSMYKICHLILFPTMLIMGCRTTITTVEYDHQGFHINGNTYDEKMMKDVLNRRDITQIKLISELNPFW